MSSSNPSRRRPQKYQNRTAFKNDLHDTSKKTKIINSLEVSGVCKRCKVIIEWKIKYKKYKPLTAPSKCVNCQQKTVKYAYHVLCTKCAKEKNVCAKCKIPIENEEHVEASTVQVPDTEIQTILKGLPERKRRTILRYINKQEAEQKMTPEVMSHIEEVLSEINLSNDLDDFLSGGSGADGSDDED